ncbi:MAG TPA: helix-turn-helix domain-containing protein [Nocardioides sp.]
MSQQKVLTAIRAAGADGMTSHEAAKKTGLKNTNTPRILKTLEERGLVEGVGGSPVIWRAVSADRPDTT